jgi:uncharacterized protein (DUF58 family)
MALAPALGVSAFLFGQPDLLRAAVLMLVLPVVAMLVVVRTRYRLTCVRVMDPAVVPVGSIATVHLHLRNVSRLPSGVLLMEDTLPLVLGGRPRFVLDRIEAGGDREVTYSVQPATRGRFRLGPLGVRLSDPFGLCELHRSFSAIDHLLVTPAVVPLPNVRVGGDRSSSGETPSAALASGTDDVTTREYRHGDDLRKVHWRSTAKVGDLMVRQEEQPRQQRATLVLDSRRSAHAGEGNRSSYEAAVSATASIGIALVRAGFAVHLDGEGIPAPFDTAPTTSSLLLGALADVALLEPRAGIAGTVERLGEAVGGSTQVAVLGALTAPEAEQLARVTGPGRIAVLLDTPTWAGAARGGVELAATILRRSGWRVLTLGQGDDLAAAWSSLGTVSPGRLQVGA